MKISGTVKDKGAPIPRARVVIKSTDCTVHRCTETNDNGYFEFPRLPKGKEYELTAFGMVELGTAAASDRSREQDITVARQACFTQASAVQIARQLPGPLDPETLEKYGKLVLAAIGTVAAVGGIFKGTVFQELVWGGTLALSIAVIPAAISAALVLLSILEARKAGRCAEKDPKWARRALKWALGSFALALFVAGLAPLASTLDWPHHRLGPRYGISYSLDSAGTLSASFEGRALPSQLAIQLYARIRDSMLSPQAGGLTDDSGSITLALRVRDFGCPSADSARVVARWGPEDSPDSVSTHVHCPAGRP